MSGHKIETLFAYIAKDDGCEGICAFHSKKLGMIPMVGSDTIAIEDLKLMAQNIANVKQVEITLCEFSVKKVIGVIKPEEVKG